MRVLLIPALALGLTACGTTTTPEGTPAGPAPDGGRVTAGTDAVGAPTGPLAGQGTTDTGERELGLSGPMGGIPSETDPLALPGATPTWTPTAAPSPSPTTWPDDGMPGGQIPPDPFVTNRTQGTSELPPPPAWTPDGR